MYNANIIDTLKNIETPFYYYDIEVLKTVLKAAKESSTKYGYNVHYAIKANSNARILDEVKSYGFGTDCVSGNEILKVLEHGFDHKTIAFAGVGKSDKEINIAIDSNIGVFHIESVAELTVINELAKAKNKVVNIALRINPDVDAKTHEYITTGLSENKFGINTWEINGIIDNIHSLKNIKFIGLHFHIGSQILDMSVFEELAGKVNVFIDTFEKNSIPVKYINLGGGLGVDYVDTDNKTPDFEALFKAVSSNLKIKPDVEVHFELGRSLVATCGDLIAKVLYIKKTLNKKFAIIDAGMTDLIRPALYNSVHKVENLTSTSKKENYDVVGPICESSDTFAEDLLLPKTTRGDIIVIKTTGAYGQVMASNYNMKDFAKDYYSDEINI